MNSCVSRRYKYEGECVREERTLADTLINHDQLNRFEMEFFSPLLSAALLLHRCARSKPVDSCAAI